MTDVKGPAIDSEAFRVEGHCCGIRIPALTDHDSQGVRFEITPEIRSEVLEAAMQPAKAPPKPPTEGDLSELRPIPR